MKHLPSPVSVAIRAMLSLFIVVFLAVTPAWCSERQSTKTSKCWTPEKSGYTGANYQLCRSVCRKHHRLRHWVWSGIFPFEGGFIPDPHFVCSKDEAVSTPVATALGDRNSEYAIVDINPFFDDRSSETVLLMGSHLGTFEYSLKLQRHKGIPVVLAEPSRPPAQIIPYKGGLAVLVNFFGAGKGWFVVTTPLQAGGSLELIPAGSPEFEMIAATLKSVGQERTVKEQFCRSTNDFMWFYEKYVGACSEQTHTRSEIEENFSRFWLQH